MVLSYFGYNSLFHYFPMTSERITDSTITRQLTDVNMINELYQHSIKTLEKYQNSYPNDNITDQLKKIKHEICIALQLTTSNALENITKLNNVNQDCTTVDAKLQAGSYGIPSNVYCLGTHHTGQSVVQFVEDVNIKLPYGTQVMEYCSTCTIGTSGETNQFCKVNIPHGTKYTIKNDINKIVHKTEADQLYIINDSSCKNESTSEGNYVTFDVYCPNRTADGKTLYFFKDRKIMLVTC